MSLMLCAVRSEYEPGYILQIAKGRWVEETEQALMWFDETS